MTNLMNNFEDALEKCTQGYLQKDARQDAREPQPVNVNEVERLISGIVGFSLVKGGLRRVSLGGLIEAAIGGSLLYRAFTGHCACYSKLGVTSAKPAEPEEYFQRGIHVQVSTTINKPAGELYAYWRNFENLPRIMSHLDSVTKVDDKRSHWVAKAPVGQSVQWDAEIINDEPDKVIAWRSLGGAQVDNAGSVRFTPAPGGRGTEVSVTLEYIPPAGQLGSWIAWLFGEEPKLQIEEDLHHFKQIMEAGEIATTEGQSRGEGTAARSI